MGYHVDLFHFNPPDDANSWYFIDVVWWKWIKQSGRCFFVSDVLGSCRHPLLFPDAKNSLQDAETQQLPWQQHKQITEMHHCARDVQLFFRDAGDDGTCWCKLQWSSFFHIKEAWLWQLYGIFDRLIRWKKKSLMRNYCSYMAFTTHLKMDYVIAGSVQLCQDAASRSSKIYCVGQIEPFIKTERQLKRTSESMK